FTQFRLEAAEVAEESLRASVKTLRQNAPAAIDLDLAAIGPGGNPLAVAPPIADPARLAPGPPAGDLRVAPERVLLQTRFEPAQAIQQFFAAGSAGDGLLEGLGFEPGVPGVQVGLVHRPVAPLRHFVGLALDGPPEVADVAVGVRNDAVDATVLGPGQEH